MKWFLKGTVLGAVSAVVILTATAALAGSGVGAVFNLGRTNSVNRQSALVGTATGAMLRVQNKGTGPAASFQVAAGKAPFAPKDKEELRVLLDAFRLEKALSMLEHALYHRPDLIRVHLHGIEQVLVVLPHG